MIAYKGTDMNGKCRGMQYEVGKEYTADGDVSCCQNGLHACEAPLDVFSYYPPAYSRYFEVEPSGAINRGEDDTKLAARTLKIKSEIGIPEIVKAQIEYTKEKIGFDEAIRRANAEKENHATGDRGAASTTGDRGAASATGYRGAASATGNLGAASATGYQGAASATGNRGAASATGNLGAASATGNLGAASATGNQGAASATGNQGAASATGNRGAASATGNLGAASATGNLGAASATGKAGVALAAGNACKAMGALGCAICCVERGEWNGETYPIVAVKAAIVDGETIMPGVWYALKNAVFVEVKE